MVATLGSLTFFGEMFEFFLVFIFLFVVMYGILSKTKFLTEKADTNAVVSFALAMMAALSGIVGFFVALLPYYIMIFIILFVVFFLGKFAGLDVDKWFKEKGVLAAVLVIFILITFFVGWNQYSESVLQTAGNETNETILNLTGNPLQNMATVYNYECVEKGGIFGSMTGIGILCLILHPRVLGAIIILLVTSIIVFFVQYERKK